MTQKNFNKLGLSHEVIMAVDEMGYEQPTDIQSSCIPLILAGRDVIGHSQTGTGKTMAFGLPAVDLINTQDRATQVLILCPTRELAVQAAEEIKKAVLYKPGINVVPIYGGAPIEPQTKELKRGAHIVVGTPGRIMDHMRRRRLKLGALKMMVLDEADEMLNMGFRDDIETILRDVPEKRITVLFSATMSNDIMRLTKNYQTNAQHVKSADKNMTVAKIDQWFCNVPRGKKVEATLRLLTYHKPQLSLIFCNTKRMVDELVDRLKKNDISAVALHGDLNQHQRNRVMKAYKSGSFPVLVATDVAARGIDVDDIEMVFNYDIPLDDEYYVHRIGRTGRAGKSGMAVTYVGGNSQMGQIRNIERFIKARIPKRDLPSHADVEKIRRIEFVKTLKEEMKSKKSHQYSKTIDELVAEGLDIKDIACALLSMMNKKETVKAKPEGKLKNYNNTGGERGMVRFFINLGRKDRIAPGDLVGCIAGEANINGSEIGKIDVFDKFSFVEVPDVHAPKVHGSLGGVSIRGRKINIEPANGRQ
jgi:ATP-dependent RNA helicase DeaD